METEAVAHGWVPEEEFKADPKNEGKKWRTAEDFMDRKSLFDKIDEQHREIRKLRDGQSALLQHNQNVESKTRERLLAELKAQKAEAVKEGDVVKIEELRDKIEEVKEQTPAPQVASSNTIPPEFQTWINENNWYTADPDMRAFADAYGVAQHQRGKSPADVLKEVSKKVKEVYPSKFQNPAKVTAPPIEGGSGRKVNGTSRADLEPWEEAIWDRMERSGVPSMKDSKKRMTRDEYVEQLKAARGVR